MQSIISLNNQIEDLKLENNKLKSKLSEFLDQSPISIAPLTERTEDLKLHLTLRHSLLKDKIKVERPPEQVKRELELLYPSKTKK